LRLPVNLLAVKSEHRSLLILYNRLVAKGEDEFVNRCQYGTEKPVAPHGTAHYTAHMKTKAKPSTGKRGRPTGPATKRINARFPSGLAEKIEYAASLRGVAVAAFIQEAVAERADQVIEAESHWQLTREEAANLAAMIAKPPKPNQAMLNAAKLAARHVVIRS
jgi:uncharacterized protein (DUF1778 family)